MEKNDAQISGFAVVEKAPSPLKKIFLKKKFLQLIVQLRSTKRYAEIFKK